jgi:hypothetical protein
MTTASTGFAAPQWGTRAPTHRLPVQADAHIARRSRSGRMIRTIQVDSQIELSATEMAIRGGRNRLLQCQVDVHTYCVEKTEIPPFG